MPANDATLFLMRVYCHLCGTRYAAGQSNPWKCAGCGNVAYENPVPTVAIVLFNDAGEVLVTVRGKEPFKGKHGLPAGFVGLKETLDEALKREVQEEISLKPEDYSELIYVGNFSGEYPFSKEVIVTLCSVFTAKLLPHGKPRADDDVASFTFVSLDKLGTIEFSRQAFPGLIRRASHIILGQE